MPDEISESADDAAYRARVRAWLEENAAEYKKPRKFSDEESVVHAKAWAKKKWENGYSGIAMPKEAGGAGGTARQAQIFAEEEQRYKIPLNLGPGASLGMAAILKHGTPEQIKKWGTLIHSGGAFVCQLFSEPAAGSDLAGLRTRAVKDGEKWIVNGQKVWSTWAHLADYGILVARTDPSVPKHKGLSFFVIDMHQPGVTTRPIHQITGHSDFNETFLDDAIVSDEDRIGAEGEGWAVTMTVLAAERHHAGTAGADRRGPPVSSTDNLLRLARNAKRENGTALDNASIRAKIAQWHVEEQGVKNFGLRLQAKMAKGEAPPPTMPLMKLTSGRRGQLVHAFIMDLEEYGGIVQDPNAPEDYDKFFDYMYSPVWRIAGGADEVLRNQLAERALGMPSEMRVDKDVPFKDLPF